MSKFTEYSVSKLKRTRGREGYGFTCDILRNGKKIGTAEDWADGGPVRVDINSAEEMVEFDAMAKALPALQDVQYERSENAVNQLVAIEENRLDLVKLLKTKLLVLTADDKLMAAKLGTTPIAALKADVLKKFPGATVLNDEKFEDALDALYDAKVYRLPF